ncbi:hypothetical protein Hanom_Chr03g00194861 [Helianthus anomalus]
MQLIYAYMSCTQHFERFSKKKKKKIIFLLFTQNYLINCFLPKTIHLLLPKPFYLLESIITTFLLSSLVLYVFIFRNFFVSCFFSKFCGPTHRNWRVWFNVFTFRSKFCELIRHNVRVWFNVFTSSIFFSFDNFDIKCGSLIDLVINYHV